MTTGVSKSYGPDQIEQLVVDLQEGDTLAGHNICGFDLPVLEKLYGYDVTNGQTYFDTLAMSCCIYPGSRVTSILRKLDIKSMNFKKKHMDDEMIGRHSLKAWGQRLKLAAHGQGKIDYTGGWESFNDDMMTYCEGDVALNVILLRHLLKKGWPEIVHHTESFLSYILYRQQLYGVGFNENEAATLMADLTQQRSDLTRSLQATFPPIEVPNGPPKQWKKDMVCRKFKPGDEGYWEPRVKGEWHQKMKTEEFNPGSGPHIAKRLTALYGWKPQNFTPSGIPSTTDEILRDLPWPEAIQCADYQVLKKALGYISEGKAAWLKLTDEGRLHGRVQSCGAVTHRASHSSPNLANVPSKKTPYGEVCRALFTAGGGAVPSNYMMVGCDASSLQLSIFGHYLSRYDGGVLARLCEDPKGDPHEHMRLASGLFIRDNQKTYTYAWIFGAQAYKLGTIVLDDWRAAFDQKLTDEQAPGLSQAGALGTAANAKMEHSMVGFKEMRKATNKAARRGHIVALDGRKIPVDQERLALLTLLQGNEAVIMKHAFVIAWRRLQDEIVAGITHPSLWVHDEFQWASHPDHADLIGQALSESITEAGHKLGLSLTLGADYKVGKTWAETH